MTVLKVASKKSAAERVLRIAGIEKRRWWLDYKLFRLRSIQVSDKERCFNEDGVLKPQVDYKNCLPTR